MSDSKSDAAAAAQLTRPSPLSPHMQVWRWHITMAASILTRFTGVALYGGFLIVALGALLLATSADAYNDYVALLGSLPGRFVLFGITFSIFYHMAAGVRHLVWDFGKGFEPKTANMSAIICMAFGLVAAIVVWMLAGVTGGA
jgi:succinate dehydrogenase / fumarate reductase, cytochrome b subunit